MLTNNLIVGNRVSYNGSGLYVNGSYPRLLHTTIARNSGGDGSGVYATGGSTVALTNTILVSQTMGIFATSSNTATLEATLWGSGASANGSDWGGTGSIVTGSINLRGNPAFISQATGDYHIGSLSAAINAGINADVTSDMDGEVRPHGDGYDIGADEFSSPPTLVITMWASPDPVQTGTQLTYTLRITNTSDMTLHGIVTDVLPAHVMPTGTLTWTAVITALGGVWGRQVAITVEMGYIGPLTNVVRSTTDEGASGLYTETVAAVGPLTSIMIVPNPVTVTVGTTQTFTASGADAFGNAVPISLTWTTDAGTMSNNALAAQTIPANGKHVTATVGNVSGTAIVNVVTGPLASITVTPNPVTVTVGATETFTASGADAFGNAVTINPVWSTDAGTMTDNVLTAQTTLASGRHVTATVESMSGTAKWIVSDTAIVNVVAGPLASITVTPNLVTVTVGATQVFTASGADTFGNAIFINPTWSTDTGAMTSNVLTAQTTPASGKHVTATVRSISGRAAVKIVAGPLSHLAITPTAVTLAMRQSQQFSASGFDAYSNAISGLPLSWQVTPSDAGTIDATGLFIAGTQAGVYPGAVVVTSGVISSTADVIVRWPYQVYLPVVLRQSP